MLPSYLLVVGREDAGLVEEALGRGDEAARYRAELDGGAADSDD